MIITESFAQAAPSQTAPNPAMQFLPMVLIFVVFYFLLIRPNMKRQKTHALMLKNLKIGDRVVTNSGIIGVIKGLTENVVTLEISNSVRVQIVRSQIGQIAGSNLEDVQVTS